VPIACLANSANYFTCNNQQKRAAHAAPFCLLGGAIALDVLLRPLVGKDEFAANFQAFPQTNLVRR